MKWRNTKERELLANGDGNRESTIPNKSNPTPDLTDLKHNEDDAWCQSIDSTCSGDSDISYKTSQQQTDFKDRLYDTLLPYTHNEENATTSSFVKFCQRYDGNTMPI